MYTSWVGKRTHIHEFGQSMDVYTRVWGGACDADGVVELFGEVRRLLPRHGVDHQQHLMGMRGYPLSPRSSTFSLMRSNLDFCISGHSRLLSRWAKHVVCGDAARVTLPGVGLGKHLLRLEDVLDGLELVHQLVVHHLRGCRAFNI